MPDKPIADLNECWTAHHENQVALVLKLSGQTVAVRLDLDRIALIREQLNAAELFLTNYSKPDAPSDNQRGR